MKIIDTVPFFLQEYQPSVQFLQRYYAEYPEIFKEYFAYHCKDTEERHLQSIGKYPEALTAINQVHDNITSIIEEITQAYFTIYQITLPIEVNLIVGGFGSNAYTYRQIIPNITFALEKLSPEPDHLRAIVAHEFGHATHNIISDQYALEWKSLQWGSPLTWLLQEGAATHFSRVTAPNLDPSIYFSYNSQGHGWLSFADANRQKIINEFGKDLSKKPLEALFKEWFSINGGEKYGYSRLGYYVGDRLFQHLVKSKGELSAILAWKEQDFEEEAKSWLGIGGS